MGAVKLNIQELYKKPHVYSECFCPEQSTGNLAVYCDCECEKFVIRKDKASGNIVFAGCAEHWIALCLDKGL